MEEKIEEVSNIRLNQDRLIALRTKELRNIQSRLFEAEKRSLEHRITGGFAHEMRNALAGAQLEFRSILNYKQQGLHATDAIKISTTRLFENLEQLQKKYQIPMDEIASSFIPEIKDIASVLGDLSQTMSGVHKDLERGLAITNQIREYAKLSEMKPGAEEVDLMAVLHRMRDQFRRELEESGIECVIDGQESVSFQANETHMISIFSNMIKNSIDALVEQSNPQGKIGAKVNIEPMENESKIVISISDNGPGIPEENREEVFEAFFSTKPTSGTGLGLGIVKRLVQLYDGAISINNSTPNGAQFDISFPDHSKIL